MYLRHATRCKGGKRHTSWRLVRSVRYGRKVRQEIVAHLGELDAKGRAQAKLLARQITGQGDQRELCEADLARGDAVEVRLDQVRTERTRVFGGVWLGWKLWRALGFDALCAELLPRGRALSANDRETVGWR